MKHGHARAVLDWFLAVLCNIKYRSEITTPMKFRLATLALNLFLFIFLGYFSLGTGQFESYAPRRKTR